MSAALTQHITFSYRIKGKKSVKLLNKMARDVNLVWNYCNETSFRAIKTRRWFMSSFDLNYLFTGSSKLLSTSAVINQQVSKEFVTKRNQHHKAKLKWRISTGSKRSRGWVPCGKGVCFTAPSTCTYLKHTFKFWQDRPFQGTLKCSTFSQNAQGHWFVNATCEVPAGAAPHGGRIIGIDLGLKDKLTCSDGVKLTRPNLTTKHAKKLAKAQRAGHKKQVRNIYAKMKNERKDWAHKTTTELCKTSAQIVVGDISSKSLARTRLAKSIHDAGHFQLKSMLFYKALRHGTDFKLVSERFSTVTCSACASRTGPKGLGDLGVRQWECGTCGALHDRDVNAAQNILLSGQGIDLRREAAQGSVCHIIDEPI